MDLNAFTKEMEFRGGNMGESNQEDEQRRIVLIPFAGTISDQIVFSCE